MLPAEAHAGALVWLSDAAGLVGVAAILGAYAAAQLGRLDPVRPASLALNLFGAALIMVSLLHAFNLSAFLVEAAWAILAAWGLVRCALERRRRRPSDPF